MQVKNIDLKMTLSGEYEVILTVPRNEQKTVMKLMEDFILQNITDGEYVYLHEHAERK